MTVDQSLANLSFDLVRAAMAAYTLALIAFAVAFAAGRTAAAPQEVRELATVGAPGLRAAPVAPAAGSSSDARPTPGRRAGNIGMSLMWLATILLFAGVLTRGLSVHRVPWGNMYEFSVASGLAVSIAFLAVSLRRDVRWLGLLVCIPVLLTLGLAVTVLYVAAGELVPNLNSYWLVIHVSAAIICGASFAVGAAVTVLYLFADRARAKAELQQSAPISAWVAKRVPDPERLDLLAYRIHAFMFPLWTFAIIAGAIWAENAWGRYWGWDPKETWAFITWVVYACYLHARATAGWRGRRAAVLALAGFSCFVINYYIVNLFGAGLHAYAR